VPLSMCCWLVSDDDVLQRHGTPSQAEPTSTPEAIQDQQRPSDKYQCTGIFMPCHSCSTLGLIDISKLANINVWMMTPEYSEPSLTQPDVRSSKISRVAN
jgi:hypothetical protein